MRKLCVFNPSHDSVMQYGTRAVTPPQIATKMWRSMGALACLWSDDERSDALTEDMIGSDGYAKFTNGKPVYSSRTRGYTYSTVNSSDVLLNPEYRVTQNVYPYYFVKDHLGSNRMVADSPSTMVSYYPYGGIYYDDILFYQADDNHLYNGKEMDRMYGLDWLDYGARMDNPAICLWTQTDPLAEKFYHINPYLYCAGNPVRFIDPDGERPTVSEAARIAAHVYGDKSDKILTGGWKKSDKDFGVPLTTESGLLSAIYEREIDGKTEYVYATAGTQDWNDAKADLLQPLGLSSQYSQAADNARKISNALGELAELNYVGHSLGGGEAALNSLVTSSKELPGREAITFNAARVSDITKATNGNLLTPFKAENKITAYVMMFDPVNRLTFTANGQIHTIWPNNWSSIYNGHSMDNILRCFNINPNPQ